MIKVKVPGSCGEIVQGTESGRPFLITCPINCYTEVRVTRVSGERIGLGEKSMRALDAACHKLGISEFPYGIRLTTELPHGKGMASSTADIASVLYAVSTAMNRPFSADTVAKLAASIEPTDGTFFSGIVKMEPLTGKVLKSWSDVPNIRIAVLDTGGTVDTISFHNRADLLSLYHVQEHEAARAASFLNDSLSIDNMAHAASISALSHQTVLTKHSLPDILECSLSNGAAGLNVAHSGTVIGIWFDVHTTESKRAHCIRTLLDKFSSLTYLRTVDLISGGVDIN